MIIGVSGKIGSGKDTVGKIIQYLTSGLDKTDVSYKEFSNRFPDLPKDYKSDWKIKKFADKLKDIVCLLIGCTREQLEDEEFKNTELGDNWVKYRVVNKYHPIFNGKWFSTREELDEYYEEWKLKHFDDIFIKEGLYLTPRLLMQLLGTDCGRNIIHLNIWVNSLMSSYVPIDDTKRQSMGNVIDYSNCEYPNWIITDLRFLNEFEAIKKRKGITIRIAKGVMKAIDVRNQHESETALDTYAMDHFIRNDGTIEDLILSVKSILIQHKIITE
jgi:hypothetical protein